MSLKINSVEFPERHENPAAGNKVALQSFFYDAGVLVDPVECNLCKLENSFNSVLNQKEFEDLREIISLKLYSLSKKP